jgi:hypothetical protein
MALVVQTAPTATQLSTLARIKAELGIGASDASADLVLSDMLTRASSAIAYECGRPFFGVGTYTETLKGTGSQLLAVICVPILSISAIYQDDDLLTPIDPTNPADPALTDGYYVEDAEAGAIYRPGGWGQSLSLMSWGWQAYSSRYILPGGTMTLRYTVTYSAGYVLPGQQPPGAEGDRRPPLPHPTLPGGLEQACIVTVKQWWFRRARDLDGTHVRSADQDITYSAALTAQDAQLLPPAALGMLREYRRVN